MFRIKFSEISGEPKKINREFIGTPIAEFSDIFDRFAMKYAIKVLLACDELHKKSMKPKTERKCRFCKATYNNSEKFKPLAHLLPALMGNEHLFSDFECSKCNKLFGTYENSLANFLGVARALNINNLKKGNINFKSPDKTFIVKKNSQAIDGLPKLRIESHETEKEHFTLDPENKKVTFHTIRHSYNPHQVYKAFLKIALSILPDCYTDDYKIAFAMLHSNKKNEATDNPLFMLNMYFHPGPAFPSPMAILFEKKNKEDAIPMHIACIMFHNYTYQLVLPFNNFDKLLYDGKRIITVPTMPPFIDKHFAAAYGNPKGHRLNFNLDELKKMSPHDITYSFNHYTDTWLTKNNTQE